MQPLKKALTDCDILLDQNAGDFPKVEYSFEFESQKGYITFKIPKVEKKKKEDNTNKKQKGKKNKGKEEVPKEKKEEKKVCSTLSH